MTSLRAPSPVRAPSTARDRLVRLARRCDVRARRALGSASYGVLCARLLRVVM